MNSVHRRSLGEWFFGLFTRPHRHVDTGWSRKKPVEQTVVPPVQPAPVAQQVAPIYPVLPPKPYLKGDGMFAYHAAHPLPEQPRTQPVVTRLAQLPIQVRQKVVAQLPPGGIARSNMENVPTEKRLSPDMLPPHVSGHIPTASGMLPDNRIIMDRAQASQPLNRIHLQPVPPEQVSEPPEWLVEEPTMPTRKPSAYLICQQPTLHNWEEEIIQLAERKEEDIPTLHVPSITENIAKKYRRKGE